MNLLERATALLTPQMDPKSRHTFLVLTYYSNHRQVYESIDQSGAPRDFTAHCVAKLLSIGKLDGRHALSLLLEQVAKESGGDKQEAFRQLIEELDALPDEPMLAPATFSNPPPVSINVGPGGVYANKIEGHVNTGVQFNGPVTAGRDVITGDKISHNYDGTEDDEHK